MKAPLTTVLLLAASSLLFACDSGATGGTADAVAGDDAADTLISVADTAEPAPDTFVDTTPRNFVNGATGVVGHIIDGDTLDVCMGIVEPTCFRVRLLGINAPECLKKQVPPDWQHSCYADDEFYGNASFVGLRDLYAAKTVKVSCDRGVAVGAWCTKDDFDRYLAYLEVDGKDMATELAWHGHAFSFTSFNVEKRAQICAAEYDARANHRGIWSAASTWQAVIAMESTQTQNWYKSHDSKCDAALGK